MGQGYSSNPLLDMRIHDIFVEADIKRHVPSVPEPDGADGSNVGSIQYTVENPDPESDQNKQDLLNQMANIIFEWLDQWWPRLRGTYSGYDEYGGCIFVQVSVDLLGSFQIDSMIFDTPLDDELSESELVALQVGPPNPIDDLGGPLAIMATALSLYWYALNTLITFTVLVSSLAIGVAITAFLVLWGGWLLAIEIGVNSGRISLDAARALTIGFVFALAGEMALFVFLAAAAVIIKNGFSTVRNLFKGMVGLAERWGVASFLIKLAILLITLYQYIRYYDMTVIDSTANH